MMTWQYIAGFFDGEGWFAIQAGRSPGAAIWASIGQKDQSVLLQIKKFLSEKGIKATMKGPYSCRNSITNLTISSASLSLFLEGILPFLVVKKIMAQDALRLRKLYPSLPSGRQKIGRIIFRGGQNE